MSNFSDYSSYREPEPEHALTDGEVRGIAGRIAGSIIETARTSTQPIAWVTGNSYMPPGRAFTEAERVWQDKGNDDGELYAFLWEEIERHLDRAGVLLESPEWDNALYAVDLKRWTFNENAAGDDLNDEWEPAELASA